MSEVHSSNCTLVSYGLLGCIWDDMEACQLIQVIFVPGWFPTPLNKLMTVHHMTAGKMKARDRETIGRAVMVHATALPIGPRKIDLHLIVPKGQRKWDRDGLFKSLLDGLVHCGALKNDSPSWCRLGSVTYSRAEDTLTGTMILLEDLP